MPLKMRRNFACSCASRGAEQGAWRLKCEVPHEAVIIIRGADAQASVAFDANLADLGIEWQTQRALLTLSSGGGVARVQAATVIVHEPAATLYRALPLADFDRSARRFWRRVFLLLRIPGGRSLLGMLAHVSRKRA